nr:titin-like [Paramormyrops kingsleyae]
MVPEAKHAAIKKGEKPKSKEVPAHKEATKKVIEKEMPPHALEMAPKQVISDKEDILPSEMIFQKQRIQKIKKTDEICQDKILISDQEAMVPGQKSLSAMIEASSLRVPEQEKKIVPEIAPESVGPPKVPTAEKKAVPDVPKPVPDHLAEKVSPPKVPEEVKKVPEKPTAQIKKQLKAVPGTLIK